MNPGCSPLAFGIHVETLDEIRIQAYLLTRLEVEGCRLGPLRRHGKLQLLFIGLPIGELGVLPATKPLQSVSHVCHLIAVDLLHQSLRSSVSNETKALSKIGRKIQIGLFKGEGKAADIVHGGRHGCNHLPEVTVDWKLPKLDAHVSKPMDIHPRMLLLIFERFKNPAAESLGCFWKFQKNQGH